MEKSIIYESYKDNGYAIFPSLISHEKIDNILEELKNFKKANLLYYSQSEHNWRKVSTDLDQYGLLECSFENFTDLPWGRSLSKAGRNILQSNEILNALRDISDYKDFCMWQNMFFDKSTGTIDHIDTWYLDTNPMGYLVGTWVALEDISGEGGSFHIYPKSHKNKQSDWENLNHREFVDWSQKTAANFNKKPINLKKGDVLMWHPSLLHGSSLQVKEGYSRKSLTAHYHPIDLLRGGGGNKKSIDIDEYKIKLKKQKESSRSYGYEIKARPSRRSIGLFAAIGLAKYFYGGVKNAPKNLMNRKNYSNKNDNN